FCVHAEFYHENRAERIVWTSLLRALWLLFEFLTFSSNPDLVNLIIMFSLLSHSLSIAKAKPAAKSSAEQLFRNCSFTASYIKAWPALTSSEEKTRRMARALSSSDCVIGRPLFVV